MLGFPCCTNAPTAQPLGAFCISGPHEAESTPSGVVHVLVGQQASRQEMACSTFMLMKDY
jgi:hypothetical protein